MSQWQVTNVDIIRLELYQEHDAGGSGYQVTMSQYHTLWSESVNIKRSHAI